MAIAGTTTKVLNQDITKDDDLRFDGRRFGFWEECWPITKAQATRVEVAELRMLRWICDKTMIGMIPNGVFRADLDVDSIVDKMREGRLRWFGHVKRRPRNASVRRVEAMKVEGSRRRGTHGEIELRLAGRSIRPWFSINPYAHVHWPEVHWKQSLYFRVTLEVGVGSVYTSPPPYPAPARL
nr:polyprotein, putative [Tanacetum cinerariifolium]